MLLKQKSSGHMVEVEDLSELVNPFHHHVLAQQQWGEDLSDPEPLPKNDLCFLSDEPLPTCWTDEHYRQHHLSSGCNFVAENYYGA